MPMQREYDLDGTPEGVFGGELRFFREQAGLTQGQLAARVHVSHDVISKIETGQRPPARDFPERVDAVPEMDTRGGLARLWRRLSKAARQGVYPGWFRPWPEIEADATTLRWYEPLLVPGLLQTEDYAHTILSVSPGADKDKLDEQVAARMDRQAILERADGPQLWCVLDETVLYRPIGGAKVMRGQLDHLARLADEPKTTVQIIPAPVGAHAGLLGAFILADLDDHTWLYLETSAEGQISENKSLISGVAYRFDRLRSEALPRTASRDLIMKVAEDRWT
jgi:transcriptional regulator with XRE-family HTH domain